MKVITNSASETEELGYKLASRLKGKEVIAFYGDLGAGKTTFTRGIAKYFNTTEDVSSPTYAIAHEYEGENCKIYHFDMYRINSYEDLESTGFFDYLDKGVIVIEWSENVEEFLPKDIIRINIAKNIDNEEQRVIDIEGIEI